MKITLTIQQENFLNKQLATGKYADVNEVINKAFALLAQEELEEKNKSVDPERQKLAEQFSKLCAETQAIPGIQDITETEILAEIEAYRRGE